MTSLRRAPKSRTALGASVPIVTAAAVALAGCTSSSGTRPTADRAPTDQLAVSPPVIPIDPAPGPSPDVVATPPPAAAPVTDDISISVPLDAPVTSGVRTALGTYLVAADGGVFALSHAASFAGSMSGRPMSSSVVAVAADPAGTGYWLAGADGGVFSFNRPYLGSTGSAGVPGLIQPITAMAATPGGLGYWLVAKDGGVFAYGDAPYLGGMANHALTAPVVAVAATPSGKGYWLVAADGGVFAFGDAVFAGAPTGQQLRAPVVGILPTPSGKGYWLASADGGVFAYGDAPWLGSALDVGRGRVVGITAEPNAYRLVTDRGALLSPGEQPVAPAPQPQPQPQPQPDAARVAANTVSRSQPRRVVVPAPTATAAPRAAAPAATSLRAPSGAEIVSAVNAVRATYGLRPLAWNDRLGSLALSWTAGMAARRSLEHNALSSIITQPSWSSSFSTIGENIYSGPASSGTALVAAWMGSAPHRAEILDTRYNVVGAGAALGGGMVWATMDFGLTR